MPVSSVPRAIGEAMARDQVGDDHVLGAQAGGLHDAAGMRQRGVAQHRRGIRDAVVEAGAAAGVKVDRAHRGASAAGAAAPSRRANSGRCSTTSPW